MDSVFETTEVATGLQCLLSEYEVVFLDLRSSL